MKISLVGGGNIGGTLAHLAAAKQLAKEVVILDINQDLASGKALDIAQSMPIAGSSVKVHGSADMSQIADSSVVIVTAGMSRKPGMSRDDLLRINAEIIKNIGRQIAKFAKDAFVIVITNPLDAMAWVMKKATDFDAKKVVGMAGILDSARMSLFLAEALGVSASDVNTLVLGSHGDSMVPLIRYSTAGGLPLSEFIKARIITQQKIDEIIERTRSGGAEIVNLLKTGSAYYAPAASAIQMAESYLKDEKKILPCSVCLNGHYSVKDDVFSGTPVLIGKNGIEKVIEVSLNKEESDMFEQSLASARALIAAIKL